MGFLSSAVKSISKSAGSLLGGALSVYGSNSANQARADNAKDNNAFNSAEALKNRTFQYKEGVRARKFAKGMSSTAHRREMADLKAAGLNPILTGRYGGSSTPIVNGASGSQAVGQMPQVENEWAGAVNTAQSIQTQQSQIGVNNATSKLKGAQAVLAEALAPGAESIAKVTTQLGAVLDAVLEIIGGDAGDIGELLQQASDTASGLLQKGQEIGTSIEEAAATLEETIRNTPRDIQIWWDEVLEKARNENAHPAYGEEFYRNGEFTQ